MVSVFPWRGASRLEEEEGEQRPEQIFLDSICRLLPTTGEGDGESQRQVGPPPPTGSRHLAAAGATFPSPHQRRLKASSFSPHLHHRRLLLHPPPSPPAPVTRQLMREETSLSLLWKSLFFFWLKFREIS